MTYIIIKVSESYIKIVERWSKRLVRIWLWNSTTPKATEMLIELNDNNRDNFRRQHISEFILQSLSQ